MNMDISIKKGLKLGELDAEADTDLLDTCFINNGQLDHLLNINSAASVIVGRTGSGKSALVYKISKEVENSQIIDPNDISIRFLEHSNIVQFFNELGVKLDLFYRILWRHILTVELLKMRYGLRSESENTNLINRFEGWIKKDKVRQRALNYFQEWGDKFWLETNEQLQELTSKFTSDLKSTLGTKFSSVDISLEGAKSLTEETKSEIRSLATQVVSGLQIQKLNEVLDLLAENAFEDKQKRYYILIDKLDEDWAETETRYRFIRALIEETKSMRRIPQVKIISALRVDLLALVFDKTRDSGFQEEKYEAYLVPIAWSKSDLKQVISARVSEVYKRQYTNLEVTFNDVFPKPKKGETGEAIDYIIERTLLRPRDAIQFANECFRVAYDRPKISWRAVFAAEASYSHKRLKSLKEEWSDYYPNLDKTVEILRSIPSPFTRSNLSSDRLNALAEELFDGDDRDKCTALAKFLYDPEARITENDFQYEVIMCLYHVGVIGIKITTVDTFLWSNIDQPRISKSEAKRANKIKVQKMFKHALEIHEVMD